MKPINWRYGLIESDEHKIGVNQVRVTSDEKLSIIPATVLVSKMLTSDVTNDHCRTRNI